MGVDLDLSVRFAVGVFTVIFWGMFGLRNFVMVVARGCLCVRGLSEFGVLSYDSLVCFVLFRSGGMCFDCLQGL